MLGDLWEMHSNTHHADNQLYHVVQLRACCVAVKAPDDAATVEEGEEGNEKEEGKEELGAGIGALHGYGDWFGNGVLMLL